jgi:hypothetical protein
MEIYNPLTDKVEEVEIIKDFFGEGKDGVRFPEGYILNLDELNEKIS